jgi:O-antigen ligase
LSIPNARYARIRNIHSNSSLSTTPRVIVHSITSKSHTPLMVYWFFLLFISTIPFEAADLGFTSSSFSLSKLTGVVFFASYFLYYNPLLSKSLSQRQLLLPPHAFWWFLIYAVIYTLHCPFLPERFVDDFFGRLFTLIQLLIFFWVVSSLLKKEKLMLHALLTYVVASTLMAIGVVLRLPGFASVSVQASTGFERVTALGYNPNVVAMLWALAVAALVGLCLNPAYKRLTRLLLSILALPLLAGIVSTGSRVGTGSLLIGLLVYFLPSWRAKQRWAAILLALLGISATIYLIVHNSSTTQRWQGALYERNFAGREKIVPAAIELVSERPIFGWQPVRAQDELARRLYHIHSFPISKDAHNLLLHLLLEVGLVGTVPFLIGFWLCGKAAWKARSQRAGVMPLALFCIIFAASLTQTAVLRKPLWLVLALASASASMTTAGRTSLKAP